MRFLLVRDDKLNLKRFFSFIKNYGVLIERGLFNDQNIVNICGKSSG